jgi:hypothetical protein
MQSTLRQRSVLIALIVFTALVSVAAPLGAQEHTDRFELTEQFIRGTWVHPVRAMDVKVLGPGPVHNPTDDCELHIGAELHDPTISDFPNIVLEPPNVCKDNRKASKQAWRDFYDTAKNRSCVSEGFIRVWPEHLSGGVPPSNPNHFMELHPMRSLNCASNSFSIDTRVQLAAHSDLGFKTAGQISTLARSFRLWVRRTPHPENPALSTIAFDYFACTFANGTESCGFGKSGLHNFARLHVDTIGSTRRCSGGGTNGEPFRTILGRARAVSPSGDLATRSQMTKLYAVEGTNFFASLGDCAVSGPATNEFDVLAIFTIDALAVVKVLDRISKENLDDQWVEVSFPVAWIVFGEMPSN